MKINQWIYCPYGRGKKNNILKTKTTHFPRNAVGQIKSWNPDFCLVWLIGNDEIWYVRSNEIVILNVEKTGDKFTHKICNICHCFLPVENFEKNQNNIHGSVRRPSCRGCRKNINKFSLKKEHQKTVKEKRPKKGSAFKCPICKKRSIVEITAHIVADHNHNTGEIRDFICDSCNTGLGRFKNGKNYLTNAINYIKKHNKTKSEK